MGFSRFMASNTGRAVRVIAGVALIVIGGLLGCSSELTAHREDATGPVHQDRRSSADAKDGSSSTSTSAVIGVFADIWCPFTHVGLRAIEKQRARAGRRMSPSGCGHSRSSR